MVSRHPEEEREVQDRMSREILHPGRQAGRHVAGRWRRPLQAGEKRQCERRPSQR